MKNTAVFIFVAVLFFSLFIGTFISTAQGATVNTSFSGISITPKTAAQGQQISIIATISPEPPSGYAYHGITFNVIDKNGNYRNLGSNKTLTGTGTCYFSWVPDIVGKYSLIIIYPGETLAGIVHTSCQGNDSFFVDPSLPTPSPTPTSDPNPEPTPTSTIISTQGIETSLNVNCQSSTTYSNFKVNIQGTLTANNAALSDSPIQLSYSVDGGNSWIPLTFLSTDDAGAFQAVWTPFVTGNYFLRATYEGNSQLSPASTIVHFAVLPFKDTSVFSVASNSTVTALAFNVTSQELSFKVSGEPGTTGYVNVYISNSLISSISRLSVFMDNEELQPSTQAQGDSWLISFTYHHSVHSVALELNSDSRNTSLQTQEFQYVAFGIIVIIVTIVVIMTILRGRRKNNQN